MFNLARSILTQSSAGDWLGRVPFLPNVYAKRIWRRRMNLFYGVFGSFDAAEAQARKFAGTTWDDDTLADMLVDDSGAPKEESFKTFQSSYFPYILWLSKILRPNMQVVDLGGAGGIGFELFERYVNTPEGVRWHVVDMAALINRGRRRHGDDHPVLSFSEELDDAPDCDVLASAGCIQYMEDPLGEIGRMLARSKAPSYVLLNKVPVTSGAEYWTLQNLGSVVSPYRVFDRKGLLGFFADRGYELCDEWDALDVWVDIPFHSERTLPSTKGLVFRQIGAA